MKTKYIKELLITITLTFMLVGCSGYDVDVIDKLLVDRTFAPVGLTAKVRNQTTVELNWTAKANVDHYVVEISEDDPNFSTIYKTVEVKAEQLPIQIPLEGETVYSIRVKAVSIDDLEDSKWAIGQATTLTEQLMLPTIPGDIKAKEAIFRWVANSNVTKIVVNPGEITHTITAQEKTAGIATVTGLTGETNYTAKLYNNAKIRGTAAFVTGIDIGTGILVKPTDDLFQKIADAKAGDILVLEPGDYTAQSGTISLSKSITLRGLRSYDKPKLKVSISINAGATDVSLIDLDMLGDNVSIIDVVRFSETGNYNSLTMIGCNVHDFDRSFIAGNASAAKVNDVMVDNCVVTNVITNGGDFIDFRNTHAGNITVKNSTFNNCAPAREFFRVDAASGLSGTGLTTNILLDSCTLYAVCNASGKRILYVRFNANVLTVKNTLFAETVAIYSNQTSTADPTFLNNNYFNATGLHTSNIKFDATTNFTTLNPGFSGAASGNFKISNQTLLDNKVGDPRWRK